MRMLKLLFAGTAAAALLGATAAQAADPVKIGVALSQTGNLADSAAPYFKGLDLWREQANARGGLAGRTIEFVVYDDRSDPATAARLYEKLITDDKVNPPGRPNTSLLAAISAVRSSEFC